MIAELGYLQRGSQKGKEGGLVISTSYRLMNLYLIMQEQSQNKAKWEQQIGSGWLFWGTVGDKTLASQKVRAVWKGGVRSKED